MKKLSGSISGLPSSKGMLLCYPNRLQVDSFPNLYEKRFGNCLPTLGFSTLHDLASKLRKLDLKWRGAGFLRKKSSLTYFQTLSHQISLLTNFDTLSHLTSFIRCVNITI